MGCFTLAHSCTHTAMCSLDATFGSDSPTQFCKPLSVVCILWQCCEDCTTIFMLFDPTLAAAVQLMKLAAEVFQVD